MDSGPEYLEKLHGNMQQFFQTDLLKLLLYNTKPSIVDLKPTGRTNSAADAETQLNLFESPVIVRSFLPMTNVAHNSILTLV